jgi:hypothetical protein
MRQITKDAIRAFYNREKFTRDNTSVLIKYGDYVELRLHNNLIAMIKEGSLYITNAGWMSTTTKERLNGLSGVSIYQKNYQWFLNGIAWDGSLVNIDTWGKR